MSLVAIILLAIALSIDACVVAFAHGLCITENRWRNSFLLAVFTGTFQGLMPIIGYFLAQSIHTFIAPVSKWLVFFIFAYLCLKFIQESFEKERDVPLCISTKCLFMIAIATSIDALAAGVSISLTNTKILFPAALIAAITFVNTLLGFWAGCSLKKFPTQILEITAGLILIILAFKSLF
jgi:putative Mn2+ efflux pump MntP